jgi:hypothetical protein
MATIVKLPARRQGPSAAADIEHVATILFFTGVRYERDTEPENEDAPETEVDHEHDPSVSARAVI